MRWNKCKTFALSLFFLGIIHLIAFGVVRWIILPMFSSDEVIQTLRMFYGEGGAGDHWIKFNVSSYEYFEPTVLLIYVFNVTNPNSVTKSGAKPVLREVGPYIYTVQTITEILSSDAEAQTTDLRQKTLYHFSRIRTPAHLQESDIVTVPNVPYLETVASIANAPSQNSILASLSITSKKEEDDNVFLRKPVSEILFSGIEQSSFASPSVSRLLGARQRKSDTFYFLNPRNGSLTGSFTVYTGLLPESNGSGPLKMFGDVLRYGSNDLGVELQKDASNCHHVEGTVDGMIFPPLSRTGGSISILLPELCRILKLQLTGESSQFTPMIESYKFALNALLLARSEAEEDCRCFNATNTSETRCVDNDTLSYCNNADELFPHLPESPFVVTLPHFLGNEKPQLLNDVTGLQPRYELHGSYVELEPISGFATSSRARFQVNYKMRPLLNADDAKSLPELLFPILWTSQQKTMNPVFISTLQEKLYKPMGMAFFGMWAACVGGAALIVAAAAVHFCARKRKKMTLDAETSHEMKMTRSHDPGTETEGEVTLSFLKAGNASGKGKTSVELGDSNGYQSLACDETDFDPSTTEKINKDTKIYFSVTFSCII